MTLVQEFIQKKNLPREFGAIEGRTRFGDECLFLEHPTALARFISFVKSRTSHAEVFLRGQDREYPGMVPALFRDANDDECRHRFTAYSAAISRLQRHLGYDRFRRGNDGALFQHYGLRTPWIDLVDNLYTAIWFAQHSHGKDLTGKSFYRRSDQTHGWLTLVVTEASGATLPWIDLRKHHSSMSLRPQAQHGFSAAAQHDAEPCANVFDYRQFVCARIRIPNSAPFLSQGGLLTTRFMFPPRSLDESYGILIDENANEAVEITERSFGLDVGTLGRISELRYGFGGRRAGG